ncbi:MAG: L,D-transpeptidase [Verrucomicrobiales bacterium]|nr:L,D-transpeptidase [Verrucomicrobiales bacterium]
MNSSRFSFLLLTASFLLSAPVTQGQDGKILQALFGSKPTNSSSKNVGKRVEIDLTKQQLRAYQGNRVVLKTHISSGRTGNTPTGNFRAGPYKSAEHYSSLYHNAPMPWSVQITGHIFIHGFTEVPRYPASKGCVRVPLTGRNPAKRLFNWIDVGTPIRVYRS